MFSHREFKTRAQQEAETAFTELIKADNVEAVQKKAAEEPSLLTRNLCHRNYTKTALHYAAECGSEKVSAFLLAQDSVDIEAKSHDNLTPLFSAVKHDHQNVAALLIAAGAKFETKTSSVFEVHTYNFRRQNYLKKKREKLRYAIEKSDLETVKQFGNESIQWFESLIGDKQYQRHVSWRMSYQHEKQYKQNTALHYASEQNRTDIVTYIASTLAEHHKKSVNDILQTKGWSDWTPLHFACYNSCVEILDLLLAVPGALQLGAEKVEPKDKSKNLILQLQRTLKSAIKDGDLFTVTKFAMQNVEWLTCNLNKTTAIHIAAHEGQIKVLNHMLTLLSMEYGKPKLSFAESFDRNHQTPFMRAATGNNIDSAYYLKNLGVDVNKKATKRNAAGVIHTVIGQSNYKKPVDPEMIAILLSIGVTADVADLQHSIEKRQDATTSLLLEAGIPAESVDNHERKTLKVAIESGTNNSVDMLIVAGANIVGKFGHQYAYEVRNRYGNPNRVNELRTKFVAAIKAGDIQSINKFAFQNIGWLQLPLDNLYL